MVSRIENVAFDCLNPYRLAQFWSQATNHPLHPDSTAGDPAVIIPGDPSRPTLYFQQVEAGKTIKNRVHVCLCPDVTRDIEAERLQALGATVAGDYRDPDGSGHIVLIDPEGNEFCLLRTHAELPAGHVRLLSAKPIANAVEVLGERLKWNGGETDLWPLLSDPAATAIVAAGMAEPFRGKVDLVLGPDPGGILFGSLVARELGVPFAPVCRDREFFFQGPHKAVTATTGGGRLFMHKAAVTEKSRILLVDDWSESGATVTGVIDAVSTTPSRMIAVALLVDSLPSSVRQRLVARGIQIHALTTVEVMAGRLSSERVRLRRDR